MKKSFFAFLVAAQIVFYPTITRGSEKGLCSVSEINVASCKFRNGKYVSYCAQEGGVYYRFGNRSKIELNVKFSGEKKIFRWIDLNTYITFLGFDRGGYSYIFGVPQETLGAKAFLVVKKTSEKFSYNDTFTCVSNSFGDKAVKIKAISDVDDSLVRTKAGLVFPPVY